MSLNICRQCKYQGQMCQFLAEGTNATLFQTILLANRGFNYSRQKTTYRPEVNSLFDFEFKCNGFKDKKEANDNAE